MPLSKDSLKGEKAEAKAEKKEAKAEPVELSPSAYALSVSGEYDPYADPLSEGERKRAELYQAEKHKQRWGY